MLEKPNQMKGNIWSSYFEIGKQTKVMLHRKRKKLTLMKICLHNNSLYYSYNLSVSIIFSSVAQSCPTLCNPMGCSMPGFPVHHQLPELAQTHVHWFSDAIQLFHPLSSPSPPVFNFSQHQGLFPVSQLFASGGQSIGVSASPSILPKNIQDWSPLGLTGWISLKSKGISRVFSNTTVQKHQLSGAQLSSQSNSHNHIWLLEKL